MKKLYIMPTSTTVNIQTEGVIATSELGNGGTVKPGEGEYNGEFLSNKGGWNSLYWSEIEE